MAAELTVDVNVMPRIVFVGDSQTCGCVGAWDYPQMLSWEMPLRVFNRAVGGSNTMHLLEPFGGGTVTVKKGERLVVGEGTSWFAGPYVGMTVRLGQQEYTLDHIETTDYAKRNCNMVLAEPAREDFSGTDYQFEAGWRVRVAEVKPRYACFMYSVNDAGRTSEDFKAKLAEIVRHCREAGIQPIFLSGVPMMDAAAGGSHPGSVETSARRAQDLQEFCTQERLPYGDVLRTLMKLDGQHTAEWVDTIHPTTDGSMPAMWALRHILTELGVAQNPYYMRCHRAPDKGLPDPVSGALLPISTSQPRYDRNNRPSESGFTLEARRLCDEYGLLAEPDGEALTSDRPVILKFGVGDAKKITGGELNLAVAGPVSVSLYDCQSCRWREIGSGKGRFTVPLTEAQLRTAAHEGALFVGVVANEIELDYAGLKLAGDLQSFTPEPSAKPIMWPAPGQFDWSDARNLLPNGAFMEAAVGVPVGWRAMGTGATYIGNNAVARGSGEFRGDRLNQFHCAGQKFTQTVRPLDVLQIAEGPDGCAGRFLVASVTNDEELVLRRLAKGAATVNFEIIRSSGCPAVPGGCAVEACGDAGWEATTQRLAAGTYRLSFFCRAFDPKNMTAKARPGAVAEVTVADEAGKLVATKSDFDCTYFCQRTHLIVKQSRPGKLTVRLQAAAGKTVQYTGLTLTRE